MTRSKHGQEFWHQHLAAWAQSGQPLAVYAREHDVPADSLRYYRAKSKSIKAKTFVAARAATVRPPAPKAPASVVIAVSDRVDAAWLVVLARGFEA
jgi:nucleoid-associated protein YgaU